MSKKGGLNKRPTKREVIELIARRRRQICVHSYAYYILDDPFVTDDQYEEIVKSLKVLQARLPEYSDMCLVLHRNFHKSRSWYHTTYHIPYNAPVEWPHLRHVVIDLAIQSKLTQAKYAQDEKLKKGFQNAARAYMELKIREIMKRERKHGRRLQKALQSM